MTGLSKFDLPDIACDLTIAHVHIAMAILKWYIVQPSYLEKRQIFERHILNPGTILDFTI